LLLEFGFDICAPFRVADYNEKVTKFLLPTWESDNVGIIIGSTKAFWYGFTSFIRSVQEVPKNPVDTYCQETIQKIVSALNLSKESYDLRFDTDTPASGHYVHVQTAGHVAGVAYYDQDTMWSASTEFGVWFVFRAVITLSVPFSSITSPIISPVPIFTTETKKEMKELTQQAMSEQWSDPATLLAIREVCLIGKEKYRYSGLMLDYFYPVNTSRMAVIQRIRQ